MDQKLNVRTKIIKGLQENIVVNLHDLGCNIRFLNTTPKAKATKLNIEKLYFLKIQNFCVSQDTIKKVKRQSKKQREEKVRDRIEDRQTNRLKIYIQTITYMFNYYVPEPLVSILSPLTPLLFITY